jgi:hypothetical protein
VPFCDLHSSRGENAGMCYEVNIPVSCSSISCRQSRRKAASGDCPGLAALQAARRLIRSDRTAQTAGAGQPRFLRHVRAEFTRHAVTLAEPLAGTIRFA